MIKIPPKIINPFDTEVYISDTFKFQKTVAIGTPICPPIEPGELAQTKFYLGITHWSFIPLHKIDYHNWQYKTIRDTTPWYKGMPLMLTSTTIPTKENVLVLEGPMMLNHRKFFYKILWKGDIYFIEEVYIKQLQLNDINEEEKETE